MATRIPYPLDPAHGAGTRILESFPFGLVLVSSTGNVRFCNDLARRWLGCSQATDDFPVGGDLASLVAPFDPLVKLVHGRGVPTEGRTTFDFLAGDELFTVSVTVVPLMQVDSSMGTHALIFEDVSELVFASALLNNAGWSPSPTMIPFLPRRVVQPGLEKSPALIHQLLEMLVTPAVVLDGSPPRVAWSNAAARLTIDCPLGRKAVLTSAVAPGRHLMVLDRRMGDVEVVAVPMPGIGTIALMELSMVLLHGGLGPADDVDLPQSAIE